MTDTLTVETWSFPRTRGGNNPGTEYASAKTGIGVVRFFENADVSFAKSKGAGVFSCTVETNGNYKNGKNLSMVSALPVPQQAAQPSQNGAGRAFTPGADFRTPAQFMRSTAVEQAVSMVSAIFSRMPSLDAMMILPEGEERMMPIQEDAIGILNAQAMELYLNWYDIFETSISKGLGVSADPVPVVTGPRASGGDVTSRFWQEAKEGWPESKDFRIDANNWLVGLPEFGKGFADLTPDKRQEALTALLKEMGKAS